jgi:Arc/MetJ family transcription regulator
MTIDLAINGDLLQTAFAVSGLKTKKDTVNAALDEFVQKRQNQVAVELNKRKLGTLKGKGTVTFADDWYMTDEELVNS